MNENMYEFLKCIKKCEFMSTFKIYIQLRTIVRSLHYC